MKKVWRQANWVQRGGILMMAFALFLALVTVASAATEERPYIIRDYTGLDSVQIKPYQDTSTVADTTISIMSFPDTGVVTINDQTYWRIEWIAFYNGDDTGRIVDEIVNMNTPTRVDLPAADTFNNWVTVFIDVGAGYIDTTTGTMVPRTDIDLYIELVGAFVFYTGDWTVVPRVYERRPSAAGRATFHLPRTDSLTPSGGYYILTMRAARSHSAQEIRRFIINDTTNPININATTEAQR